jgi:RHS repeat-associated protein
MKMGYTSFAVMLFLGVLFHVHSLAAIVVYPSEEIVMDYPFTKRHFALQDAVAGGKEYYGYTKEPEHSPLEIVESDIPDSEYMAVSPYYKVFFKGTTVKMVVQDAWITFSLVEQELGKVNTAVLMAEQNSLSVLNVVDSVDLSYTVDTSLLTEVLTLRESKEFDRIIQKVSWEGMNPVYEEDGSLLFLHEGKELLKILPPFMKDAKGSVCEDIHYELMETETGYKLHKVIDEKGLNWLEEAVYPVTIDPSIQIFEDAWESSGLTPFGQYFKNVKEYVNPATGYLTVTQTDLTIPGRGLDVVISRVYQTPAVFYGLNPYEYEAPPTDVGKGWQLNFPHIGTKYLHLWGGTVYKIAWVNNIFENHKGAHFILVKNGDSTYTLTTASGTVYEFNTSGKLTKIKDLDQNSITFTYTDGNLTSITDTIGRTVNLSYSNNRLWKITYNGAEIEFSYDSNGCLQWIEDFLNRRTSYEYNTGYNNWLLSKIEYPTTGYTTYTYNRFTDTDYHKYYVTNQRVYETNQVRHAACSLTGDFDHITASSVTVKNESDSVKGSYQFTVNDGLITERIVKNASGAAIRTFMYTYNTRHEITQESVYADGTTLSYTNYYGYDNWGNMIYAKNAEGHEKFFSYANTDTEGFFIDNTGAIIRHFTNAFTNSTVPSSVHTALLGVAEKQDAVYVKEVYITYDVKAHPTQSKDLFGNHTTWLTYSGTFNEYTGDTSFPIDLTGHTVTGNGVLQITGQSSADTYTETHAYTPGYGTGCRNADWTNCSWQNQYYKTRYNYMCGQCPDCDFYQGWAYIGPFTHYPGTVGYQSYSTAPNCNQKAHSFSVTTYWKAYPVEVQYNVNGFDWKTISSNLKNTTATITVSSLTNGQNTVYFNESSSYKTAFSWYLYVPVDTTPDTYTTTMTYDSYGNVTSITDPESNIVSFTYSSSYSYAHLTEISATVNQDTITHKATYDFNRGWITSIKQPKGVAGSGYDTLYTYDLLGRTLKKEFPLLSGQSQRAYLEAIYDDANRTVTLIDQLRHYTTWHYDKLGRLTTVKAYTGEYGSGTVYAAISYASRYDNKIATVTDPGNDTYSFTYDFLGRYTQIQYPDSSTVSYSYDDTNNNVTFTNQRGYHKVSWFDWLNRLEKVEQEYTTTMFAVTVYQYDEIGHLTSFTDAENHTTIHEYASFYGLTKSVYPDSTYEEYAYNSIGNLVSFTDANDNETTFAYDSVYRLTQIQYQDQSAVSFTYDLNSNRTKMEDDAPYMGDYVEYSYDRWNRLTSEVRHISTSTYTLSYQYDTANRLTTLIYPDNMQILYSYDDLNRTTEINLIDSSIHEIVMDNIQYDTENVITQFDYGNDLQATFSYDSKDRLSTLDVKNGATSYLDLDYTYDNNSNITQLVNGWRDTSSDWHTETELYSYDGLDRLTSASCTSWSHTYSYDKAGNRTSKDSVIYTINSVNEVTALSDTTFFTYDDNGNRTQKTKGLDTWVYTYDYANRLTKIEKNATTEGEYVYDGDGKRIQVTEDSTTTYMYSQLNILYEENSTGSACYIYGPTGRLGKRTTIQEETHIYYYHTDHGGSTRLITDENKTIVTAVIYHPFGEPYIKEGSEHYLFCGKEMDATGLYYYGARYYDSDLGRFITRDPLKGTIVNPQTLNQYTYCRNNPLKYTDPWGEKDTLHDIPPNGSENESEAEEEKKVEVLNPGDEGHPGNGIPHEDGYIYLHTAVHKCGNVGVAIGSYDTSTNPFGGVTTGFVIFIYADDGSLKNILFYSFEKMFDSKTGTEKFDEFVDILEDSGINLECFNNIRESLEIECISKMKKSGNLATGASVCGFGLTFLSFKSTTFGIVGIPIALWGITQTARNNTWTHRTLIMGNLGDSVWKRL